MQKFRIGGESCSCLLWSNNLWIVLYWCIYLLFCASPFRVAPLKVHGRNISSCTISGQMFKGTLQVWPAVFFYCDDVKIFTFQYSLSFITPGGFLMRLWLPMKIFLKSSLLIEF
jgi:hypothetical protein